MKRRFGTETAPQGAARGGMTQLIRDDHGGGQRVARCLRLDQLHGLDMP